MLARRSLAVLVVSFVAGVPTARAAWEKVPPMDFSKLKPADFRDDELDLPYYLEHFHELANGVVEEGPNRGFIAGAFWRGANQPPYNARVLENYLSLAFFYCTDRPWNVYRGSPAVRQRLEAVLDYWCRVQGPQGQFSEYAPQRWGTASTAFATKFMGRTLELLAKGPAIDPDLLRRVTEGDRKAIVATLTIQEFYDHGKTYTNQYYNVFGGAPAYLALHPDAEVSRLLDEVFRRADRDFQSPAGFYYEKDGPDFGYTLHTQHSDAVQAYNFLRGTALGDMIERQQRLWCQWLSYNLLREPDGSTFVINRGIETRQRHATWARLEAPWGEKVEEARAFASSREERAAEVAAMRAKLEKEWGRFTPSRDPGGQLTSENASTANASARAGANEGEGGGRRGRLSFTPYTFLDRDYYEWYPTAAERDESVSKLPYLASESFAHQRSDSRFPLVCTYVRRPTYYAAFNAGMKRTDQQRLGLGLVWNPQAGTILQTQTGTSGEAWGTRIDGQEAPVEAGNLAATLTVGGQEVKAEPGNRDLPAGEVVARYALGKGGEKSVSFGEGAIAVLAKRPGEMVEQIPLLTVRGRVEVKPGRAMISYGAVQLTIEIDAKTTARVRAGQAVVAGKRLVVVELPGRDELSYRIRFGRAGG